MRNFLPVVVLPALFLASLPIACGATDCSDDDVKTGHCRRAHKDKYRRCSTEIINADNCVVIIDRRYPVTWPTIQMKPGKNVIVLVANPLDYETLSLDESSFSLLPGTDQLASLVPNLIPQFKGLGAMTFSIPQQNVEQPPVPPPPEPLVEDLNKKPPADQDLLNLIEEQLHVMQSLLDAANKSLADSNTLDRSRIVYEQVNQALAPLPKPGAGGFGAYHPPPHAPYTPSPWTDYPHWRRMLLCELAGQPVTKDPCSGGEGGFPAPTFVNILGDISALQARLPATPPAAPSNPIFDQTTFDGIGKTVGSEIPNLLEIHRQTEKDKLTAKQAAEAVMLSRLSALASALANVQKDFLSVYQNILAAEDAVPHAQENYADVGIICDPTHHPVNPDNPNDPVCTNITHYSGFLGRQVAYAVNAVNNVANSQVSTTTASTKTTLATITVLFANPRLETSAGAIVSFVHNRTFSNQTISNAQPGSGFVNGDVVITETKTYPELIPIVAAHYRIGNEFLLGRRRGAFYGTGWVGMNLYSNVPDYGAGPTISWRSMMFSFLYNRAHETSLVAGQTVNEIVCGPAPPGATTTPPACTGTPPSPVTHTTPLNAFAIGLSVRIPTAFTGGGGVSR